MKTAVKVVCAVCILALCVAAIPVIFYGFGIFIATVNNYSEEASDDGGFSYLLRDKWSRKAAVSRYVYDPEADRAVIEIPAAYGEYPVEGLGGYVGTGFPSPFFVDIKGLDPTAGVSPQTAPLTGT